MCCHAPSSLSLSGTWLVPGQAPLSPCDSWPSTYQFYTGAKANWVGPRGAQSGWAHVGLTWAQARNLGPPKNQKGKNYQNQNPFCPKCRHVFFISRNKTLPAPFGAFPGNFLRGPEKSKKCTNFVNFPWWANGPYSTALGQWAHWWGNVEE